MIPSLIEGAKMLQNPLKVFKTLGTELLKAVENDRQLALSDGALPGKFKYLIAVALYAAHGTESGVASLAPSAMCAGASKEEVAEALRVAYFIAGVGIASIQRHTRSWLDCSVLMCSSGLYA
jgi:alkylhydroperoxidase/carboxymuconolactone decarboxylase family protein YurZ